MPAGDYLKGKYSKRTRTVMRLLREGHLSQTKIARKVGVSKQRVWTINKSYLKHLPDARLRNLLRILLNWYPVFGVSVGARGFRVDQARDARE
jgi:DNA-binding XRE family transcriptional regulator